MAALSSTSASAAARRLGIPRGILLRTKRWQIVGTVRVGETRGRMRSRRDVQARNDHIETTGPGRRPHVAKGGYGPRMLDLRAKAQQLDAEAEDRHDEAARAREEQAQREQQRGVVPERNNAGENGTMQEKGGN